MEDPTDEVSTPLPAENTVNSQRANGVMRRKVGEKTFPWMTAQAVDHTTPPPPNGRSMSVRRKFADMLEYSNPFAANPASLPPQGEDIPAPKKARIETSVSTAVDVLVGLAAQTTATLKTAFPSGFVAAVPKDAVTDSSPLQRTEAPRAPRSRRSWTPEEDAKLMKGVQKYGKDWVAVAALVPGRTNERCRHRWVNSLNTSRKMGKWTPEEDAKLIDAVKEHGNYWPQVATLVPGRTTAQCRYRWAGSLDLNSKRKMGKWTAEEDAKLTSAVQKHGNYWVFVAMLVPGRNNKDCRSRWVNSLNISRKMGKWTPEEDAKLTSAVTKYGKDWFAAAALVSGRNNKDCRSRWVNNLNISRKMGKWTPEEDAKMTDAVTKYGKDWPRVATLVPGRTNLQCRERWMNALHHRIDRAMGKWTT
jgi:hypothetical protein